MKLAIIPTLNEEKTILEVLENTKKEVDKIIVVDSSSDKTADIIKNNFPETILLYERGGGKGLAIRKAIEKAFELNPSYVIFLDADGEKDPKDIKKVMKKLENCDVVIGKRDKMRTKGRTSLNKFLSLYLKLFTGYEISDPTSGFIGMKRKSLEKLDLNSSGFEIETEFLLESYKNNLNLDEVSVKVPELSPTKLNLRDMIKINNFFDEWILRNTHLFSIKEIFLIFTCLFGLMFGKFIESVTH